MTHSDVIIGHVVTSSVKLHQEAPLLTVHHALKNLDLRSRDKCLEKKSTTTNLSLARVTSHFENLHLQR